MPNVLPQEANAPPLLHNKRQPYQICCIIRKKTNATEKQQDEIIDRIDANENPLIQNTSNQSELRNLYKNAQVEVALLQTRQCFSKKNIDLTSNTQMLGSKRFSNHHLRTPDAKEIQKFPQEKFFYYLDPRAKDPLQMRSSLL